MPTWRPPKPTTPCPWCCVLPAVMSEKDPLSDSRTGRTFWVECDSIGCPMREVSTRDCISEAEAVHTWENMAVTVVVATLPARP